jgi:hypothetical protein
MSESRDGTWARLAAQGRLTRGALTLSRVPAPTPTVTDTEAAAARALWVRIAVALVP